MGKLILVVDDHKGVRTALCQAFRQDGLDSIEAADGEEAVRVVKERGPDVILLDILMPGRDGLWACAEIRKLKGHAKTPILMCTSKGTKSDVDAALSAGADDYVVKPFHPDLILRKVRRFLGGSKPEGAERRGAMRREVTLTMLWQTHYPPPTGVVFRAQVLNVSMTGVAFRHRPEPAPELYAYEPHVVHALHPFFRYAVVNPDSEDIQLVINLPGGPVQPEGKFVYIVRQGDDEICGVQFTKLTEEDHKRIADFVTEELENLISSRHD